MDVDFAILADGVAQRPDGKLDLFGAGFDNINATQVPTVHPQFTLALQRRAWSRALPSQRVRSGS
jgi:hypothetical protein